MSSLQSLRRKIAAFKNAQKITKAMKMTVAAEHGVRIAAMDGATRNAGQLIKNVTLHYKRRARPPLLENRWTSSAVPKG